MKHYSIQTKILRTTLIIVFVLAVLLSSAGIFIVNQLSNHDSKLLMSYVCDRESFRFDNKLNLVKHSVQTIYDYAVTLETFEGMDDICSAEYEEKVREMAISIANRTDGAMAVYFRYDPDLVGNGTSGFFWSRKDDNDVFTYEPPTDITAYDANDVEHVGWFFGPKQSGEAAWTSPYLNKNLDVFMISYIMPFYDDDGNFVGVIGMDIDFNNIMKLADDVNLYNSGDASLCDLYEHIRYYSDGEGHAVSEPLSTNLYNHITTINNEDRTLIYKAASGKNAVICTNTLVNGMRLVVSAPTSEINDNRNQLIVLCISFSIVMSAVATFFIMRRTIRIVSPLKKITEVTNKYAEGDWSESYICNTGDELQTLSESVSIMAKITKSYIGEISTLARTDALTGLKNTTCYREYIETRIQDPSVTEYGIVVCDVNFLKQVNDRFGHEAGDEMLVHASRFICRIFSHSPVFRIGGDEFTVILIGEDFNHRDQLKEDFISGLNRAIPVAGNTPLSIALGMAVCPEDGTSYEDLFKLADQRMYANKELQKTTGIEKNEEKR